jgi:pyruvate/2-oxoglutarate dehydrogenase complex dihydrolipoamide dehydrogenase (E3) component
VVVPNIPKTSKVLKKIAFLGKTATRNKKIYFLKNTIILDGLFVCFYLSDDLFSLPYNPGKTLCVGASYVSLECAGFLKGIGLDVTVMVRSILLRGFDQQMANLIGDYMEKHEIKFVKGSIPVEITRIKEGQPGELLVKYKNENGEILQETYNTVLLAVGRDPCTNELNLDKVGVQLNPK